MLRTYIEYGDVAWKSRLESDDGEKLLLARTTTDAVYMLVATRHHEIIKAIQTRTLSCTDISERLEQDETAGFAAYLITDSKALGIASTLRGPRTAALSRFVGYVMAQLGAGNWQFHLQVVGSSLTIEQATGMAFVSRTMVRVGRHNPIFERLRELFAADSDDINSFEVVVRNRKNHNLRTVFRRMAEEAQGEDLDKMRIRAKAALDDNLTDFFVEEEGKLSDEIGTGAESEITRAVRTHFDRSTVLSSHIDQILEEEEYEERHVPELARLGDIAYWREHLRREQS